MEVCWLLHIAIEQVSIERFPYDQEYDRPVESEASEEIWTVVVTTAISTHVV